MSSENIISQLADAIGSDALITDFSERELGVVHNQGEQASNPARVAAINAGYAEEAAGKQLNRFCASGLEAVNSAAAQVMSGMSDLCIGGGLESMSRVPMDTVGGALAVDPKD